MHRIQADITRTRNLAPARRHRTSPRAIKRAHHNSYPVKKPGQASSTRHTGPPAIRLLNPRPPTKIKLS